MEQQTQAQQAEAAPQTAEAPAKAAPKGPEYAVKLLGEALTARRPFILTVMREDGVQTIAAGDLATRLGLAEMGVMHIKDQLVRTMTQE